MKFNFENYEHTLLEMARVGKFGECEVAIYGGEGFIPHFHFFDRESNRQGCIRLDKAKYFSHGRKNDRLNSSERKDLVAWLRSPMRRVGMSVYEYMLFLWNENNPDFEIDEQMEMPNYLELI